MNRVIVLSLILLWLCLSCGHNAWCAGNADIFAAATKGDLAAVQQLIQADNSLLNAVDLDGRTPLLYASSWGWKDIVVWLLDKGARINLRDKDNRIALHWAAGMGWKEVVAVLVAHNSDLWVPDKDLRTPLDLATLKGKTDVAALLQDAEQHHAASSDTSTDSPELIYPTRINPVDGAEMVMIPAGEFLMGDDHSKAPSEKPAHKIYLDGFWAYKNDVTVAQYRRYCTITKRLMPAAPPWGWQDDHPIVDLSWEDARAYAIWAGGTVVGMLPTEAQWEKAARGTDGRMYPWGNTWDATKCNGKDGKLNKTAPVGSFPTGASPYGLLDMIGNVDQWCLDWYDVNYYATAPASNPGGPKDAPDKATNANMDPSRVRRGGSYDSETKRLYNAHRNGMYPTGTLPKVGFRVVLLLTAK